MAERKKIGACVWGIFDGGAYFKCRAETLPGEVVCGEHASARIEQQTAIARSYIGSAAGAVRELQRLSKHTGDEVPADLRAHLQLTRKARP